jgi:rSAM/selenodomain-associated transferase 2
MLSAEFLATAFATLTQNDVVLGPATDGGYYLIGLKHPVSELFNEIHWGSSTVLYETQAILRNKGIRPALLEPLSDVDRPQDLEVWQKAVAHESNAPRSVSVIIPALNEESGLLTTLKSVQQCASQETIVVDGGSTDGTLDLAKSAGAKVLKSSPSRARQMNAGAALAEGEALLFLHADTLLPGNWLELVQHTLSQPGVAVGAFQFRIREPLRSKRLIEWGTNMRSELLALPYGDQGFFLKRALFEECGGFADQPIMEDVEFIRRMRREGQVVIARGSVQASGRRWKAGGFFRTVAVNQLMLLGYWLGVDKRRLAGFYRQIGKK